MRMLQRLHGMQVMRGQLNNVCCMLRAACAHKQVYLPEQHTTPHCRPRCTACLQQGCHDGVIDIEQSSHTAILTSAVAGPGSRCKLGTGLTSSSRRSPARLRLKPVLTPCSRCATCWASCCSSHCWCSLARRASSPCLSLPCPIKSSYKPVQRCSRMCTLSQLWQISAEACGHQCGHL